MKLNVNSDLHNTLISFTHDALLALSSSTFCSSIAMKEEVKHDNFSDFSFVMMAFFQNLLTWSSAVQIKIVLFPCSVIKSYLKHNQIMNQLNADHEDTFTEG